MIVSFRFQLEGDDGYIQLPNYNLERKDSVALKSRIKTGDILRLWSTRDLHEILHRGQHNASAQVLPTDYIFSDRGNIVILPGLDGPSFRTRLGDEPHHGYGEHGHHWFLAGGHAGILDRGR